MASLVAAVVLMLLLNGGRVSGWWWWVVVGVLFVVGLACMAVLIDLADERQQRRDDAERALPPGVGFTQARPASGRGSDEAPSRWRPPTRDPAAIIDAPPGGAVQAAAFNPAAGYAGGYLTQGLAGGEVVLWHLGAAGPRRVVSLPADSPADVGEVAAVAFNPDGMLLATGGAGTVWDLSPRTGPRRLTRLIPTGDRGGVRAVAFDPTGALLVTRSATGQSIDVWDVDHSPTDGNRDTDHDRGAGGWGVGHRVDLARGSRARDRRGALARGSGNPPGTSRAARAQPSPLIAVSTTDAHRGRGGSASPGEGVLVAAALALPRRGERVRLWSLARAGRNRQVATIDPVSSGTGLVSMAAVTPTVHGVALNPNGALLAVACEAQVVVSTGYASGGWFQAEIGLWDLFASGRPRRCFWLRGRGTSEHETAWTRRGERARDAITLTGHAGIARAVAFSPDGRALATGGDDGTALVWDVTNPYRLRLLDAVRHGNPVHTVTFDSTSTMLATTGTGGTRLWSLTRR